MRLNLYIFKHAILGCSGNPIFDDHEPDVFADGLKRKVLMAKPEEVIGYENTTLYHLGVYDDKTLRFELNQDPVLLVDFNEELADRKLKYEILKKARELAEKKEGELDGKDKK